jgi:hypothetical protein
VPYPAYFFPPLLTSLSPQKGLSRYAASTPVIMGGSLRPKVAESNHHMLPGEAEMDTIVASIEAPYHNPTLECNPSHFHAAPDHSNFMNAASFIMHNPGQPISELAVQADMHHHAHGTLPSTLYPMPHATRQ